MTLTCYSARLTYAGPDRLDVTRAHVDRCRKKSLPVPLGAAFAPSWGILASAIEARREAEALLEETYGLDPTARSVADQMVADAWNAYKPQFLAEMRISAGLRRDKWTDVERAAWMRGVRPMVASWQAVRVMERVVFCCACVDREHCHSTLLRSVVFPAYGAVDGGEVQ